MLQKQYSEHWNDIFKTITTDNGSEFADLANLEEVSKTLVYYAHPYTEGMLFLHHNQNYRNL